jgi:folate-binding protein YgfZ
MADSAFFCTLTHEGILAVRGPDAGKFLQGQITCNISYLGTSGSSLGARCTPKGRMLSSFRIVSVVEGFLLAMDRDLLEAQLADLQKYVVFSKAKLGDESETWVRFGLSGGEGALQALGLELAAEADSVASTESLLAIRLSDGRAELWTPAEQAESIRLQLSEQLPQGTLNDWLLAQIRAGIGQVTGATRELFIPQMINLQAVGGVSFKKGCYTGQEIVARMQYLGKLKRRLYRLTSAADQAPQPGTELFSPVHRSAVGEVVLAAPSANGVELLAVLQEDAAKDGNIHLGTPEGLPLDLLDLPYTLDSNREIQR